MTTWRDVLAGEKEKTYFKQLQSFVKQRRQETTVYPPEKDVYNALKYTLYDDVKVVILGQDPYHGPNQAHGLSFSVKRGVAPPPSLRNMFREMASDLACATPTTSGDLTKWAKQGVLLLNTVLTVEAGQAHSHKNRGWEQFTDRVITSLNEREKPIVFVLWGAPAQKKRVLITNERHRILQAPHPSPLSAHRGFFGSRPYSTINAQLVEWGVQPIDWLLDE